jgi:S-DNA-T family DNA segregation ATPase FtsK/SpoIIIE
VLERELDRRRHLLSASGAEHLTAYLESGEWLDRVVVLIDGFAGLADALGAGSASVVSAAGEVWNERVQRLVVEGRQVGIHVVIASDRRNSVPSRIQSAIGARLILRHADPQSYADFGVRLDRAETLDEAPGRALLDGRTSVQLASVSLDPSARAQTAAIAELARPDDRGDDRPHHLSSRPLPTVLDDVLFDVSAELASTASASVIGLTDVTSTPVDIDVEWSHAAIVGPPRSGRSTALAAFVAGWRDPSRVIVVGGGSSPLARIGLAVSKVAFGSAAEVGATLDRAANLAAVAPPGERFVVVIDDLDDLDEMTLAPAITRLLASDAVRLVAALDTRSMVGYTASAAISELRRARRILVLQPDDPAEFVQLTGVRLPARPGLRFVPGRGVLVADRVPRVVQVADRLPLSVAVTNR